jgi:hypothetical protein
VARAVHGAQVDGRFGLDAGCIALRGVRRNRNRQDTERGKCRGSEQDFGHVNLLRGVCRPKD